MTIKIFWENPYLAELETTVKTVDEEKITLYETIFYAFSGGQESDQGTFNGLPVLEARKEGKEIFYTLERNHLLKPGDSVKICIDWNRRYRLMRLHFAAELVLELVCRQFPGIIKSGAHIAQEKARIDFEMEGTIAPFVEGFQKEAQAIIDSDEFVISDFSDKSKERRYWQIQAFSQVPCGGTHIKRTSEIGTLRLKRVNPGKGKERIEIYVS